MKKIYLAIPYTGMEDSSYEQATRATALIMSTKKYNVFSPITHSHPLTKLTDVDIPGTWEFWSQVDYQYIDWCDEVWILKPKEGLTSIVNSTGVNAEIKYATEQGKEIKVFQVNDNEVIFANMTDGLKKLIIFL